LRDTTEGDTGLAQKQRDALRSVLIATLALVARLPEAEELCRRLNVESMLTLVGRYEACSTGKTQSKDEEEDGPPPRRLCLFSESEGDSGAGGFRRSFCEQDADSMYKQWQPALHMPLLSLLRSRLNFGTETPEWVRSAVRESRSPDYPWTAVHCHVSLPPYSGST